MPLLLDATALRDLARGMRLLAAQHRRDAEAQKETTSGATFERAAELAEARATTLDQLAQSAATFEIRSR